MTVDLESIESQFNTKQLNSNSAKVYEFERLRLDVLNLMLYKDGVAVEMAPKVVETLLVLVERSGEIVSKDEMMKRLWADSYVDEGNLTQYIYLLRKKLGDKADGTPMIETFRRRGYRFNGEIINGPNITGTQASDNVDEIRQNETPHLTQHPRRKTILIFGVASVAVLMLLAWFVYTRIGHPQNKASAGPPAKNILLTRLMQQANINCPTISPNGKLLAYSVIEGDGNSLWLKDMATSQSRLLMPKVNKGYRAIQFSSDGSQLFFLTAENDLARIGIEGGDPVQILQNVSNPFAISPDGRLVVFVRGTNLMIAGTDGIGERVLSSRNGESQWFSTSVTQPDWSPDGTSVTVSGGHTELGKKHSDLIIVKIADGSEQRLSTPDWAQIGDSAWLSDGSGLLVTARENNNSPTQIWHISLLDGAVRRITNDLDSYVWLSLTTDSRLLATAQRIGGSNIWIGSLDGLNDFRQITFNEAEIVGRAGMAFMPDGRIIYASPSSGNMDLWTMQADGSGPKQITSNAGDWNGRQVVTRDGGFMVFVSTRTGARAIWRERPDGSDSIQLTKGAGEDYPDLSPDGQSIYYDDVSQSESAIWRISINGGEPEKISGEYEAANPVVSPDGTLLAFVYAERPGKDLWKVAVLELKGRTIIKLFDISAFRRVLHWSADSRSLLYIAENSPNVWKQPIDGGTPKQMTFFSFEETWNFAVSPDFQKVAVSRGNASAAAVLITNFR